MALSAASAAPFGVYASGGINGYWGQTGGSRLKDYCDSGVQYATIGFVNMSPENDQSGNNFPGINFSSFCSGETFGNSIDGLPGSQLYSNCRTLKEDITYCQSQKVKVLLSIGGEFSKPEHDKTLSSNYHLSNKENAIYFADFLHNAFGRGNDSSVPRPFDDKTKGLKTVVDGYDFDLEETEYYDNQPWIDMIEQLQRCDPSLIITAAPQCPTISPWFRMEDMIQKAPFDALFVQFYNNEWCDATPEASRTKGSFNLQKWVEIVQGSDSSKKAKLYVGLPATEGSSGYISPKAVKDLVCEHRGLANWGGISLWDLNRARENLVDGKTYYDHVLEAVKSDCETPADPTPSKHSATSSTQAQTEDPSKKTSPPDSTNPETKISANKNQESFKPSTLTPEIPPQVVPEEPSHNPKPPSSDLPEKPSTHPSEVALDSTHNPHQTGPIENNTGSQSKVSPHTQDKTPVDKTEVFPNVQSVDKVKSGTNENSSSSSTESSTQSKPNNTLTNGASSHEKLNEAPLNHTNTTPGSKSDSAHDVATDSARNPHKTKTHSQPPMMIPTQKPDTFTPVTVYSTRVQTVTSCETEVLDCHKGQVVTKIISLSVVVCPVFTPAAGLPAPAAPTAVTTANEAAPAIPTSLTTSTVYSTRIVTVTACAPGLEDCQEGSIRTEAVPLYVTVCPETTPTQKTVAPTEAPQKVSDKVEVPPAVQPVARPEDDGTEGPASNRFGEPGNDRDEKPVDVQIDVPAAPKPTDKPHQLMTTVVVQNGITITKTKTAYKALTKTVCPPGADCNEEKRPAVGAAPQDSLPKEAVKPSVSARPEGESRGRNASIAGTAPGGRPFPPASEPTAASLSPVRDGGASGVVRSLAVVVAVALLQLVLVQ